MRGFETYDIRKNFDKTLESGTKVEQITPTLSIEHIVIKD
jgi:hypothetical protein